MIYLFRRVFQQRYQLKQLTELFLLAAGSVAELAAYVPGRLTFAPWTRCFLLQRVNVMAAGQGCTTSKGRKIVWESEGEVVCAVAGSPSRQD